MASFELTRMVSVIKEGEEDSSIDDGDIDAEGCENEKICRIGSTESGTTYDDEEGNILSSLFDGISTQQLESKEQIKMKCLNVTRTNASSKSIILKTGLRQLDEIRIIFKQRPLGIQIGPLNCHGFGAKITKITNECAYNQGKIIYITIHPRTYFEGETGVREQMIITGLNNVDLLGCTFDQIMNIIKSANPPITLRLKSKIKMLCSKVSKRRNSFPIASSSSKPQKLGPKRTRRMSFMNVNSTNTNTNTKPSPLMLNSFSAENMPISTILSSSSDEENEENKCNTIKEEELLSDDDDDDSKQYVVNWNNIRLGASVLKYGWGLDKEDENGDDEDEDDITFELACNALTTQGLNVYEIRAAFRLIRTQPEQIPALETFKQLTTQNKSIDNGIKSQFLSKQWLKEKNMSFVEEIKEENKAENDGDIECSDAEEEYYSDSSDSESNSLANLFEEMAVKKNIEKAEKLTPTIKPSIKEHTEIYKIRKPVSGYIDFFDDNETSSDSESISESIQIDKLFEAIGLSSPPLKDLAALYSSDDGDDGAGSSVLFGLQRDANGNFVKVVDTSDESSSYYCSDEDGAEDKGNIISSYTKTDDADMFFDECLLPQVMLKYDYNRRKDEEKES